MVTRTMISSNFISEFKEVINLIAETIEEQDIEGTVDIDINDEILTLTTNKGVFIINKQSSVQEIWLSSPISGPYHFAKNGVSWQSKNGAELLNILSNELQIKIK